jgi:ABC-type oligopeptide transport system ATPase subunit
MSAPEPLLSVRGLCVTFPARRGRAAAQAVRDVSFDIGEGETLGLVGESGSGKTTAGRAILRLLPASAGSVRLMGRELTTMSNADMRAMRRNMQFVHQNPYSSLHPRMRVADILAEPLAVHRIMPPRDAQKRVAELMDLVGLDPASADRYPHAFSGGQRQRIVIARALAVNPRLVICDEPVSALDVRTQAQIIRLLQDLQAKLGVSYLFIAHDLAVVRAISRRVAVMYAGRIVELGPVDAVYRRPAHPYTRSLLASAPSIIPALQRAKLEAPAAEIDFRRERPPDAPCAFGSAHGGTEPRWHDVGPGHGASCRHWPADVPEAEGST